MLERRPQLEPAASFNSGSCAFVKEAALYFDKLAILDPVGVSCAIIDSDDRACEAIMQLKDAGFLQMVTLADVLTEFAGRITNAIRRDIHDRKLLDLWHI
jgi:hypothetical protein